MKARPAHAQAAEVEAAGKPKLRGHQAASKGPGGCGTGAGGFKRGNTCACQGKGDEHDAEPLDQSHPDVQRAHARLAKSGRTDGDLHGFRVRRILAGKDEDGKIARFHPKAHEDAEALRSYRPAAGHVAVGLRPGRPDVAEAAAIDRLRRQQAKGEPLNEHELAALADRDASHVPAPNRLDYDDSVLDGHRFLVHDRTTGTNEVWSERDLRSRPEHARESMRGGAYHVATRQFDSHGVEVPVDGERFRQALAPASGSKRGARHVQPGREMDREFAKAAGVRRARFGTAEPKY